MSRIHLRIFQDDILMRTYSYSLLNHKEVHMSSTNRAIRSIKGRKSLQYFSSNCDKSLHWHFFMMNCKVSCTRVVEEWQWSCMGRIQICLELRVLLLLNLTLIKGTRFQRTPRCSLAKVNGRVYKFVVGVD